MYTLHFQQQMLKQEKRVVVILDFFFFSEKPRQVIKSAVFEGKRKQTLHLLHADLRC